MDFIEMFGSSHSENSRSVERELQRVILELKEIISEIKLSKGTNASTVPVPHDLKYYRMEKKFMIERTLKVNHAHPLVKQADILMEEMQNAEKPEYTRKSLPLLLHQHFADRVNQLVQCKHQHLLRWKRFCTNTKYMEKVYSQYTEKLRKVIREYEDCLSRAKRLSIAKISRGKTDTEILTYIRIDDVLIYLRWLICHLNSMSKFNQYLKVLQWLPVSQSQEFSSCKFFENKTIYDHLKLLEYFHVHLLTYTQIAFSFPNDEMYGSQLSIRYKEIKKERKHMSSSTSSFANVISSAASLIKDQQIFKLSTQVLPVSRMPWGLGFLGGGRCSNDLTMEIPIHSLKFYDFKDQLKFLAYIYGIKCNIDHIRNLSDEMTLYSETYTRFLSVFAEQEMAKSFAAYDATEPNIKTNQLVKKPANWIPFIKLKPERNAYQEKEWTDMRQGQQIDLLLQKQANFSRINDAEKVMAVLKNHLSILSEEIIPEVITEKNAQYQQKTESLWKKIYSNPNLYQQKTATDSGECDDLFEETSELQDFQSDSYDYDSTLKMLRLDRMCPDEKDTTMTHGAYLSLLFLRHLRIRDLQHSCLLSLNYLRSIERTLTINDGGLSLKEDHPKATSCQDNPNITELNETSGSGGGLNSHGYLYNTPADFKISEADFMEFSDIENHDDYYEIKDGTIYVKDQRGVYIIYDETLNDFNALEEDLLLLGSHYIEKDKNIRDKSRTDKNFLANEKSNNLHIPDYAFLHVDRFGIILDAWTQEVAFHNCKKDLIRCYFEAYCNVFDRDERRLLAQQITQIIHQRPRYHSRYTTYFNNAYFNECINLNKHTTLVMTILNQQIEDQRHYIEQLGEEMHGLPLPIVKKHPISIHTNKAALTPLFLLEFHPTLALASRIPKAIDYIIQELTFLYCLNDSENIFIIERKVLDIALKKWNTMKIAGLSFSPEVQCDLFSNSFVDHAALMSNMASHLIDNQEHESRQNFREKTLQMINNVRTVLEVVNLRYRLIDAAWETEILSEIYKKQAQEFSFGEHHLHLRCIPFEYASYKSVKKIEPSFTMTVLDDDSSLDRYVPKNIQLAIHEYDTVQVGQFSFKSMESVEKLLTSDGLQKMRVILKCQLCQRNALMTCVQQVYYCHSRVIQAETHPAYKDETISRLETRSHRFKSKSKTFDSSSSLPKRKSCEDEFSSKIFPETFISLQLEKNPVRDIMLNKYLADLQKSGKMNANEAEAYKRSVISSYCDDFFTHMSQYSLRNQIIACYKSLQKILDYLPQIRSTYFVIGAYMNDYTVTHSENGPDKLNQVLSLDGKEVSNIWYLPHSTEIVQLYRTLNDQSCIEALTNMLRICSPLHDIIHYIFAHVKLGSNRVHFFTGQEGSDSSFVSGGLEGIHSEFSEIQNQIQSLANPNCPVLVGELLTMRRDITFLEFDLSLRHSVMEMFLMSGNRKAYEALSNNMDRSLTLLSDAKRDSLFNMNLKVPEPFDASDEKAKSLYPWMSFLGCHGPFPSIFWPSYMIEYYIQLCMSSLKDVDRTIASGEILGVGIRMEDMLRSEFPPIKELRRETISFGIVDITSLSEMAKKVLDKQTERYKRVYPNVPIDVDVEEVQDEDSMMERKVDPIDIYTLLQFCLLIWKQLEVAKQEWISFSQLIFSGNPIEDYQEICKHYRQEIMFPVLQCLAKKYGQIDLYVGMAQVSDPMIIPKGTSELEVKVCQLKRILENIDYHLTQKVLKKIQQDMSLAIAERSREEAVLPTDLWRCPVEVCLQKEVRRQFPTECVGVFRNKAINKSIQLTYPVEMKDFRQTLLSKVTKPSIRPRELTYTFTEAHLNDCLHTLAQDMIRRERYTYESYSSHYEKLIKVYHDQLYSKEREICQFQEDKQVMQESATTAVECKMVDKTFHLLMEITCLRHSVEELTEANSQKNTSAHEEVREEYNDLVENFFLASSQLREKFDVFRCELKDDVMEKIATIRRQAVEQMEEVSWKYKLPGEAKGLQGNLSRAEELHLLQADNVQLNILLFKLRTMNTWRQNVSQANFLKTMNKLMKEVNKLKAENIRLNLLSNKKNQLLKEQVTTLRHELANSEKRFSAVKAQLDAELRLKEEILHYKRRTLQYEQQKDQIMQEHRDKKLVDEHETPLLNKRRPKSAMPTFSSTSHNKTKSRQCSSQPSSLPRHFHSAASGRSTRIGWAKNQYPTADSREARTAERRQMMQRPRTVTGRLRSYFNNQLTTQEDLYQLSNILDSDDK